MRIAIVTLTKNGANLAHKIKEKLLKEYPFVELNIYEKNNRFSYKKEKIVYDKISDLIRKIWEEYEIIICIMAMGIVVRTIAPYLEHKSKDPGIIVIDEKGQFVISTLSGHLGGANEWTKNIASLIGANKVITTSTDVQGYIAPDEIARILSCKIDNFNDLVKMNASITEGNVPKYYIDNKLNWADIYVKKCQEQGVEVSRVNNWNDIKFNKLSICITDKLIDEELKDKNIKQKLILRPPTISLGIGCRKNVSLEFVNDAIKKALNECHLSEKSIGKMASVEIKKEEKALLKYSKTMMIPIEFYKLEIIKDCINKNNLKESEFVKKILGVGNICEAAALIAGKTSQIIKKKTKYNKVTIAIAKGDWLWSEWDQETLKK